MRRFAIVLAFWFSGCGATDGIADVAGSDAGSGAPIAGMQASADLPSWCSNEGGLWTITADGRAASECATRVAARTFGHALCTCETLSGEGALSTSSYGASAMQTVSTGAAVGVNGTAARGALLPAMQIGGSLTLAGSAEVTLAAIPQVVAGDLRSSAPLAASAGMAALRVERDAWLPAASPVDATRLSIGRDLYLAPASEADGQSARWSAAMVSGRIARADLRMPPPCPCAPSQRLDVAAMVAWAESHNDNAGLGFAADELYWVAQPTTRTLPCGRYHFDTINGTGALTLRIDAPVAIFVGDLLGFITIELGPRGSLDLFVAGWFQPRGGVLGSRDRPSATRVYVHDQPQPGPILLIGELVSNLAAPTAGAQTRGVLRRGSMLVRELIVSDTLTVQYDPAVADPGVCGGGAGDACSGCGECADGLACIEGACAACASDADCCDPLTCVGGRCGPLRL